MSGVRHQVLGKATVTSKGQLTIPARVRRTMGIARGEQLVFEAHPSGVLIRKAATARDLMGVVPSLPVDWKDMRRNAWADRAGRLAAADRPGRSSATPTSSSDS